jgi:hypothetical protein
MEHYDYRQRLLRELEDLSVKKDRLTRYIDSAPEEETEYERQQEGIMKDYIFVLEQRILKIMYKGDN